jgi:hypothetical protein
VAPQRGRLQLLLLLLLLLLLQVAARQRQQGVDGLQQAVALLGCRLQQQ